MFRKGNVALYKKELALVLEAGDKLDIQREGGASLKVREKDLEPFHEGPVSSFAALERDAASLPEPDLDTAWALLEGREAGMAELSDLALGSSTAASFYKMRAALASSPLFQEAEGLRWKPLERTEIERRRREKEGKEADKARYASQLEALRAGKVPEDGGRILQEIEAMARGESEKSRVLKDLGFQETPEAAHKLLLRLGAWDRTVNPWPARLAPARKAPAMPDAPLARDDRGPGGKGSRVDLRGMEAFAIDSPWSNDPDDAVGFQDGFLWVHVADPASALRPGSPLDAEARFRAATLYLPEGAVRMLPDALLASFGLGLAEESPALSFKIGVAPDGSIGSCEVMPSLTRVTRLTYAEAELRLGESPFKELMDIALANEAKRMRAGSVSIEIPECHLSVADGRVSIEAFERHRSSMLVREAMLLAGEAAARLARGAGMAFPFVTQEPPSESSHPGGPESLAAQFALRRTMRPRFVSTSPSQHAGLGLALYAQVTSPLRRYTDLLAHYQLRALAMGEPPLGEEELVRLIGEAEASLPGIRQAERHSDQHWTIAYLEQEGSREYEGVVVDSQGNKAQVFIPAIGLETRVLAGRQCEGDEVISLRFEKADIAALQAIFSAAR